MNELSRERTFAERLGELLPRLLGQAGALPEDWEAEATTYDLPRFDSEAGFMQRFEAALHTIAARDLQDPAAIRELLSACGHPYDYARLGHPLSTVYEHYLSSLSGAEAVISFASASKPFLAPIEVLHYQGDGVLGRPVALYAEQALPLSQAGKQALSELGVMLHEHWQGPLPARSEQGLRIYVSQELPDRVALADFDADAVCCPVPEGGVLLVRRADQVDLRAIQLIRKRTVAALLAANAKAELLRLAGLPNQPELPNAQVSDCDRLLGEIYPELAESLYFCTGLAAEAAVFKATAGEFPAGSLRLYYAQNGYGGTCQLIADLLGREGLIRPCPLPVLGLDPAGRQVTLIERFCAELMALEGEPVCLFLETPTNPELQLHDFETLMRALKAYQQRFGLQVPVLVDTTLAPLYPLLAQDFARDWPFVIVKSGSKYFTKGKAILGLAFCADEPLARRILAGARAFGRDEDSFAKSTQLGALAEGLRDLQPRMKRIAAQTQRLAGLIRAMMERRGLDLTLYSMGPEQVEAGLASGMLSFYLPPAPSSHADLVDEFVDYLLAEAPELVRNRVSYGQSSGAGRPDVFYVINPQESTQGSLPESVKAAQKKSNVQICRISVPEQGDVEALAKVIEGFLDRKYSNYSKYEPEVATETQASIEAEIRACEQRLYAAQLASDTRVLAELLDDELLFVGPSGELLGKQEDLALHRSGGIRITRLEPSELELRVLPGVAIAISRVGLAGSMLGTDFANEVRYTRVWKQTGQGWRVIAGHVSAVH